MAVVIQAQFSEVRNKGNVWVGISEDDAGRRVLANELFSWIEVEEAVAVRGWYRGVAPVQSRRIILLRVSRRSLRSSDVGVLRPVLSIEGEEGGFLIGNMNAPLYLNEIVGTDLEFFGIAAVLGVFEDAKPSGLALDTSLLVTEAVESLSAPVAGDTGLLWTDEEPVRRVSDACG